MQKGNTTNTVLVILLVIIVAFGVWYMTSNNAPETPEPAIELNLENQDGM